MSKLFLVFATALALASAQKIDDLEVIANNVLSNIHAHTGGEGGESSLYTFLSDSDFARGAVAALNKTKRDHIEEGVGSEGITFVSVTRGKQQVNVTTVYGVGAGAVVNIRERTREEVDVEAQEVSEQEVDEITKPLYEKWVNKYVEGDAGDAIVVRLGAGGRREFNLRDKREELKAKARGGFLVGAKTTVSKRG